MELIDCEKLLNQDKPVCYENSQVLRDWFYTGVQEMINRIETAPTIDATPVVYGYWIKVKDVCGISILKCSICGIDHPREATAYCCDCGAKMKPNFIA